MTLSCLLIVCILNVQSVYGAPKVVTPTISPPGGIYSEPQNVTINCPTIGAVTRYTTDGTEPTINSNFYFGIITVEKTTFLKAKAFLPGVEASDTATAIYTVIAKVDTPIFAPSGGTFSSNQNVTLSCSTPNATIFYTSDGSEPTTDSRVYSNPILVNTNTSFRAKAFIAGIDASDTVAAVYVIMIPKVAAPIFTPIAGTYPTTQNVSVSCSTPTAIIRYTIDGSDPNSSSTVYLTAITLAGNTTLKARAFAAGWTESDTTAAEYQIVILPPPKVATPTFNLSQGTYSSNQNLTLSCATSGAIIRYTTDGSEPSSNSNIYSSPISITSTITIKAKAFIADMIASDTATASYSITPPQETPTVKVTNPIFSPEGGIFTSPQLVSIDCANPDAIIRYTIDNSEPDSDSPIYSSPILIGENTTIKAKAFATGKNNSDTTTAKYTIEKILKIDTPTFSLAGGSYTDAQYVTIQCDTSGATIRYDVLGEEPTNSSLLYSEPILVRTNTTLRAKAFLAGMMDSDIASADYTIISDEQIVHETPPEGILSFVILTLVVPIATIVGAIMANKERNSNKPHSSRIIINKGYSVFRNQVYIFTEKNFGFNIALSK